MKIVVKSNFHLDVYCEQVVAENVNEHYGKQLVTAWNEKYLHENAQDYLALVEDSYLPYDGYKEMYGE